MNHYTYQQRLKAIWTDAVAKYESGHQKPEGFLDEKTLSELSQLGVTLMDVFDYAEDYISGGEPDFETFLMVHEVRRDYFLTTQKGVHSNDRLDSSTLPAKDSELRGIVWLPRIIQKALSKLRGELPPETMYGCGGDRKFLKTNNIHPAEFLRIVWAYEDDHEKIIDWVAARKNAS
ncbi:MAG: DUF5069 domain-containing protein [Coraliomargarita sp.]